MEQQPGVSGFKLILKSFNPYLQLEVQYYETEQANKLQELNHQPFFFFLAVLNSTKVTLLHRRRLGGGCVSPFKLVVGRCFHLLPPTKTIHYQIQNFDSLIPLPTAQDRVTHRVFYAQKNTAHDAASQLTGRTNAHNELVSTRFAHQSFVAPAL